MTEHFQAPLNGASSGRLHYLTGVARHTTILADASLTDLYQAEFERPMPRVAETGGTVTIEYARFPMIMLEKPARPAQVRLNAQIPWQIRIDGGAAGVTFDLGRGKVTGLEIHGGMKDITISLPAPAGTVPVRISGGMADVTVVRPAGTAMRVRVRGGAAHVRIDTFSTRATDHVEWSTPDYATARDRFDIEIGGGASGLTIS